MLSSGKKSEYYLDCRKVTLDPEGAFLIGSLLLERLVRSRPRVLERAELLKELWAGEAGEHAVDNALSRLRAKLPPAVARRLTTVPGKGVRFSDDQTGSVK